jgi:hypothetical protein
VRPKTACAVLLIFLAASIPAATAEADPLTSDDVLRVSFVLPSFPFPFGMPDLLSFGVGVERLEPFGSVSVSLFDGARLLGTYTSSVNGQITGGTIGLPAWFLSPTSPFIVLGPFGPGPIVDFSSIADRTIQGLIELTIAQGLVDVAFDTVRLFLTQTRPDQSGVGHVLSNPVVTSVAIAEPVPEPATWLLVVTGAALGRLRRRSLFRIHQ